MTTKTPTTSTRFLLGRRPEFLAVVLLLVFGLVNAILQPGFFSKDIVASNITTFLPLMLIAAGQFYVVLGGSIDLSLGAIVSLVNVVVVQLITHLGGGTDAIAIGVLSGIAVGAACSAVNGFLISAVRLQAIVTTFATSIVISGIALRVLPQAGGELPESYYGTYGGDVVGIPFVILSAVVLVIAILVIAKTRFVSHLTAFGGSPPVNLS